MTRPLPPLRAAVAFEASARLGSFKAAAGELGLTPSAVSHQIRLLEDYLGALLFERIGRGIVLSPDGALYFEGMADCFARLEHATSRLMEHRRTSRQRHVVTVHVPASLATKWLTPRLPAFVEEHPDIEVRLIAEDSRANYDPGAIDLVITYRRDRRGKWEGEPLLRETVMPFCSGSVHSRLPGTSPSEIVHHTLITTKSNAVTWTEWLRLNGVTVPKPQRVLHLDPSHLAIEAASRGLGFVLESDLLVEPEVDDGRLVAPLPSLGVPVEAYYIHRARHNASSIGVEVFQSWLMGAAESARSICSRFQRYAWNPGQESLVTTCGADRDGRVAQETGRSTAPLP